jgi:hypothetical protein
VTRQIDRLARHVRRLGNHELNELLLQLPKASFAALVEIALARPVLPAGLLLRFEPAPGVDGWTVMACAPRQGLGIVTRDREPGGRMVYRAWTRAGDPVQAAGSSSWRHRGDAAAALAWAMPVSGARCLALAAWRLEALRAGKRPGAGPGLTCGFGVEPPAGIEPATPSLPWIGGAPPC